MSEMSPAMLTLKEKLKATWSAGDYGTFATYMEPGAREILKGWAIKPGTNMLDVACGSGQLTIPAAEAGISATGVDIAATSLESARRRASDAGLSVDFQEGDAENLPFDDDAFDVVVSMVGAMFAPRPDRVAGELTRVCRPGGRIMMVNWTAEGFVGVMFKTVGAHVPPPAGMPSPVLWGNEDTVRERFSDGIANLTLEKKSYPLWNYPFSVPDVVEFFRLNYGPFQKAFGALDEAGQSALRQALEAAFTDYNRATDGTTSLDAEYLNVTAVPA